jgi:hypothetical protein
MKDSAYRARRAEHRRSRHTSHFVDPHSATVRLSYRCWHGLKRASVKRALVVENEHEYYSPRKPSVLGKPATTA